MEVTMGHPLGISHVSSQKQNRKGMVRAQNEQYRYMAESSSGCDNLVSEPIPGWKCAYKDVGPLKGVDCNIPYCPNGWNLTRLFGSSLASSSIETPKLSEFVREHSQDG
ncbi:unnamed protein product [Malus baccata var. baccata]